MIAQERERTIVCFGNSYTEGMGAMPSQAYPALLQSRLQNVRVINAGVSGETAGDALDRIEQDVLSRSPDLVLVEFGTNEAFRGLPVTQAWKNIEEIVRQVRKQGAHVLIVGTHFGSYQENFDEGLRLISRRYHTGLILGVLDGILSNPDLVSDPYHPNADGYRIMTEQILPEVRKFLDSSSQEGHSGGSL